jgi:hypothetical protein
MPDVATTERYRRACAGSGTPTAPSAGDGGARTGVESRIHPGLGQDRGVRDASLEELDLSPDPRAAAHGAVDAP